MQMPSKDRLTPAARGRQKICPTVRSAGPEPAGNADVKRSCTERTMADDNRLKGKIALILSGVLVAAAAVFILTGAELGGVKEVSGDADLPPVSSPETK